MRAAAVPAARYNHDPTLMPAPIVFARATLPLLILITLVVPLAIPLANARYGEPQLPPTYLPALEGPRERNEFATHRIPELQAMNPGYVVIGDSIAGTRIDEHRLAELTGQQVAPLLHPGSGSALWYLMLKNWVIASGIKPKLVVIFFRDTNLTDVLFRLDKSYRWSLDLAAGEREDDLNAVVAARLGPLHRVNRLLESTFEAERARDRVEPALTTWVARVMIPGRVRRVAFLDALNARFGLDHLRRMEAADVDAAEDELANFGKYIDESVLPLMIRDARLAGLKLCFVRGQRRPSANRPPLQSLALRRYVADLREYLTAHGAVFHDDTGDPALTLDMYADGDHIAGASRRLYTEIFYTRLQPYLQ
jgi:hypothetical protein